MPLLGTCSRFSTADRKKLCWTCSSWFSRHVSINLYLKPSAPTPEGCPWFPVASIPLTYENIIYVCTLILLKILYSALGCSPYLSFRFYGLYCHPSRKIQCLYPVPMFTSSADTSLCYITDTRHDIEFVELPYEIVNSGWSETTPD